MNKMGVQKRIKQIYSVLRCSPHVESLRPLTLQLGVILTESLIGNKEKKSVNNQISNRILTNQPTWI